MEAIFIILVTVACGIATVFLYRYLENAEIARKDSFSKYVSCASKGDMYCSHTDWCDAEIALYPEEYEAGIKIK